jgi:Arc/MetJ-type ribon-helix-helix transcriptional regulator
MPFSLRLDQQMVNKLTRLAVQSHRPVSDVVREAVEQYLAKSEIPEEGAMSAYDRAAHLIGRVDLGPGNRSEDTGRKAAAIVQELHRARRAR